MKKYLWYCLLILMTGSLASCTATYVVRERPAEVVYVRPAPPSGKHIWISGVWVWIGGRYQWHDGHYERRREAVRWEEGHWQNSRNGWKWIRGHWRCV